MSLNNKSTIIDKYLLPLGRKSFDVCKLTSCDHTYTLKDFNKFLEEKLDEIGDDGETPYIVNAELECNKLSKDQNSYVARRRKDVRPYINNLSSILSASPFFLKERDIAHFMIPNSTEFHLYALSVFKCQSLCSFADNSLPVNQIVHQLSLIHPKVIFCNNDNIEGVQIAIEKYCNEINDAGQIAIINTSLIDPIEIQNDNVFNINDILLTTTEGKRERKKFQCKERPPHLQEKVDQRTSVILWSSGTTGKPKGIQHCAKLLFCKLIDSAFGSCNSKVMVTTCFFHLGGFMTPLNHLFGSLHSSCFFCSVDTVSADIEVLARFIESIRPTSLTCGTYHMTSLLSKMDSIIGKNIDLSSLKTFTPVGSFAPPELEAKCKGLFNNLEQVINVYGSTEMGRAVTLSSTFKHAGPLLNNCVLKICDPKDSKRRFGPNEVGEILVYNEDNPMIGYVGMDTDPSLRVTDSHGFIRSGDLGYYDENGILYFKSRLKDLIKFKARHMYPSEVEDLLLQHECVVDTCVFPTPHQQYGEVVSAIVRVSQNVDVSDEVKREGWERRIRDFCDDFADRENCDPYRLRGPLIITKECLVHSQQGKLLRRETVGKFLQS